METKKRTYRLMALIIAVVAVILSVGYSGNSPL